MNEDWKIVRRSGVGGSDVAAILGLSPWKSAMDVWLEKKGLLEETSDPNREFLLELGTQLEPVIARLYERETKAKLVLPFPAQWRHKQRDILIGSPDRFVEGQARGVELKSENQFSDGFGAPGTDEVPAHYLLQCCHYMAVMDYDVWDLALLHAGTKFAIYTIHRDKELEDAVIEQLCGWWQRYVVRDVPPDIDGSKAWSLYLRKKFPANTRAMVRADEDATQLVEHLRIAKLGRESFERREAELENRIKFTIGEADGILGPFGKITWRKTKDYEKVDWELTFKDFCSAVMTRQDPEYRGEFEQLANTIQGIHTMPRQGARRFLFTQEKGWKLHGDRPTNIEARDLPADAGEIQAGDRPRLAETSERGQDGADRADIVPQKS